MQRSLGIFHGKKEKQGRVDLGSTPTSCSHGGGKRGSRGFCMRSVQIPGGLEVDREMTSYNFRTGGFESWENEVEGKRSDQKS